MIKEAIGFGATIEEAKEKAIADLGASELDDIQFEIVAMPKKKVLGMFGGVDAQVKAFIELPDKKPVQKKKIAKPQPKKEKPQEEVPVKEKAEPKKNADVTEYSEPVDQSEIDMASPTGKAIEYIKTVLTALDCKDISIKVAFRENASLIILEGEDISILIGRRGETLDSLQYLASLVANNGGGHYRISLNIGNYRQKREETLTALANRISAQVLKTGKNRTLEPMNPYERRIIHTAVQAIDGVVSVSFGEGTSRRVVIAREGAEIRPLRNNNRRGGRRQGSSSRPKAEAVSAPAREPKKDSDIPLYGKIN
ncbi:MAG: KH domain-containing protein [Clostridia bacterium]|nr:KH domain-containing protein [Clostridia bacterium]